MVRIGTKRFLAASAILALIAAVAYWVSRGRPGATANPPQRELRAETDPSLARDPEPTPTTTPEAERAYGVVAGTVRWLDTRAPVKGVHLIARAAGQTELSATTGDQGAYLFENVPAGVYYTVSTDETSGPFTVAPRKLRVSADEVFENCDLDVWAGAKIAGRVLRVEPVVDLRRGTPVPADTAGLRRVLQVAPPENPMAGVRVTVRRVDAPGRELNEIERITGADGRFEFAALPDGKYRIEAHGPPDAVVSRRHRPTKMDLKIGPEDTPPKPIVFRFSLDSFAIQGRVLDTSGEPIAGARVKAEGLYPPDGGGDGPLLDPIEGTTGLDGGYTLLGLAAADVIGTIRYAFGGQVAGERNVYRVEAWADGFAAREVLVPMITESMLAAVQDHVQEAEKTMKQNLRKYPNPIAKSQGRVLFVPDLQLDREARISGHVEDTNGELRAGVLLTPYHSPRVDSPVPLAPELVSHIEGFMTAADGGFHFSGLPAGAYDFAILESATGSFEPVVSPTLRLKAGDVLENVVLRVKSADELGAIRVHITEATSGKPMEKFDVQIQALRIAPEERRPAYGVRITEGLAVGEYLIRRISPGRAELRVTAEGYPAHWAVAEVQAGKETQINVVLQPAARIEGRITLNGEHVDDAHAYAYRVDIKLQSEARGSESQESGRYSIEALEPALYRIRAVIPRPGNCNRMESVEIELVAGETKQINFDLTGHGRIEGTLNLGPSFEAGLVWVRDARDVTPVIVNGEVIVGTALVASVRLEKSGSFEIDSLPSGDYSVVGVGVRTKQIPNGTTIAKEYIPAEKPVRVSDGEPGRVDLTVP